MKFPLVSLTLRVTPRLMVWRRLHAVSTPLMDWDIAELGRGKGSPYADGSTGLQKPGGRDELSACAIERECDLPGRVVATSIEILTTSQREFFSVFLVTKAWTTKLARESGSALERRVSGAVVRPRWRFLEMGLAGAISERIAVRLAMRRRGHELETGCACRRPVFE